MSVLRRERPDASPDMVDGKYGRQSAGDEPSNRSCCFGKCSRSLNFRYAQATELEHKYDFRSPTIISIHESRISPVLQSKIRRIYDNYYRFSIN